MQSTGNNPVFTLRREPLAGVKRRKDSGFIPCEQSAERRTVSKRDRISTVTEKRIG